MSGLCGSNVLGAEYRCKADVGGPAHARGCITRQQLALRPRSARALRRAWHRGEQHPSALRRAALWWALEALRCYPSAADSERYAANMRARAALAEVPRG